MTQVPQIESTQADPRPPNGAAKILLFVFRQGAGVTLIRVEKEAAVGPAEMLPEKVPAKVPRLSSIWF